MLEVLVVGLGNFRGMLAGFLFRDIYVSGEGFLGVVCRGRYRIWVRW